MTTTELTALRAECVKVRDGYPDGHRQRKTGSRSRLKTLTGELSVSQEYIYKWKNNEKRVTMYGRKCIVICRGTMNSCMIEFIDNKQREIVSRNSLKKV